jgi:hypothetical protein
MRDDCPLVLLLSWANRATTQRLVLTDLSGGGNPQVGRHAHEVGDGIGLHLPEHLAAMNLDCALCNAEVIAHLFVQLAADQMSEHFTLARSDVTEPESGSSPSVPTLALSRFNVMRVGLYAMDQIRLSRIVTIVFTNRDKVVTAPAYTRFDASASRPLPGRRLTPSMVAENLTNLRYVRSGAGGVLFAGPPRRLAVLMSSSY